MRFNRLIPFTILLLVLSLVSCKKGDDDPTFTLRTRKARLVGDWTMKSGNALETFYSGHSFTINTTFEGSSYERTQEYVDLGNSQHVIQSYSGNFSYNLKFRKDGSFVSTRTTDSSTVIMTGNWNFAGKDINSKNKERITITITHVDNGYTSYSYTGNNAYYNFAGSNTLFTYKIKELRNKKLVISSESYVSDRPNQRENSLNEEYTFEQ